MNICVCIKQTPDSASVYVNPITGEVDYERFVQVLNPADACAVEAAIRLKEALALYSRGDPRGRPANGNPRGRPEPGDSYIRSEPGDPHIRPEPGDPRGQASLDNPGCIIKVLTLGPKDAEGALRAALALGADSSLRLWNASAGEWGPFTVAAALAGYLKSEKALPDLILCGDSSSDWASGIVGPALAEQLDLPQVTSVVQLGLQGENEILSEAKDDTVGVQDETGVNQDETIASSLKLTVQLTRKLERGFRELLEADLPLLITVTSELNEPRYPSLPAHLAALKAEIPVLDPQTQMDDSWLNGTNELTLLEIHAPRPLPRHIPAPDSRHSAYQRIGEIVSGGAIGRKTQLVEGTPEELARVLVGFLRNKGFV